jgi:hypothetical protein
MSAPRDELPMAPVGCTLTDSGLVQQLHLGLMVGSTGAGGFGRLVGFAVGAGAVQDDLVI